MKLNKILERISAEVYSKDKLKIKYLSPNQQVLNINTSINQIDNEAAKYPNLKKHLMLIKQFISKLDINTLKTFNINQAGWDIDITNNKIIIKNDQGQTVQVLKL